MGVPAGANGSKSGAGLHMSEQTNSLLVEILGEQRKQTALIEQMNRLQILLIEALAEDQIDEDPDAQPLTYMDGTPCR